MTTSCHGSVPPGAPAKEPGRGYVRLRTSGIETVNQALLCTDFGYKVALADALGNLTLADVVDLADAIVDPKGQIGRLLVQAHGVQQQAKPSTPDLPPHFEEFKPLEQRSGAHYLDCQGVSFQS